MHNYKKHFKADGSFEIKEYRQNNKVRVVGEDNSEYIKFIDAGNTLVEVPYVAPIVATPEEQALSRTHFSKTEVRKAFRDMGIPAKLNLMIKKSTEHEEDWDDNTMVDTEHPSLVQALADEGLDINALKLQIGGLND